MMKHVYARDIWPLVQSIIEMLRAIEHEEGAALYANHLLKYWLVAAETKKDPKTFIATIQQGLSTSKGEGILLMRQLEHKFKIVPEMYR
jgi:hypothetical protein